MAALYDLRLPDAARPTPDWARRVLAVWGAAGWPVLIGNAAEKLHLARRVLGLET